MTKLTGKIWTVGIRNNKNTIDKNGNHFCLLYVRIGHQQCIKYYKTVSDIPDLSQYKEKFAEMEGEEHRGQWLIKSMKVEGNPITL